MRTRLQEDFASAVSKLKPAQGVSVKAPETERVPGDNMGWLGLIRISLPDLEVAGKVIAMKYEYTNPINLKLRFVREEWIWNRSEDTFILSTPQQAALDKDGVIAEWDNVASTGDVDHIVVYLLGFHAEKVNRAVEGGLDKFNHLTPAEKKKILNANTRGEIIRKTADGLPFVGAK